MSVLRMAGDCLKNKSNFMNQGFFNFLTKITPTFIIRKRMRFFAMQATTKFESIEHRDKEIGNLIAVCRFWAEQILKRNPNDEEATAYKSFPDKNFTDWIKSKTK